MARSIRQGSEILEALKAVQSDPSIIPTAPLGSHNLPLQLTRFIGRERELVAVTSLLVSERLVTLTGAGKTRLAFQVAHSVVGHFAHGVWAIELAPLDDPLLVPDAVVSTLGVRQESGLSITDALINFLRTRTVLLVLDNCEHLITACAELVNQVLRACPGVRVLATSREALGIAGERAWRVPSLALPDHTHPASPALVAESEAGRFFIDRTLAVAPQFVLSPQNAPIVARICECLDGLPLALELAAARMKVLSPDDIAARLGDRFQLLTDGGRTAVPRHQTLRATIDWSYDLLSEPERRLLQRLSVFAGGCCLGAAEEICGGAEPTAGGTIGLLSNLIDKSLVVVDDETGSGRRYRLLETVRQYARERLSEGGQAAALRDRHYHFFLRLAVDAEPELTGPRQVAWVRRLGADLDNLRAAMDWSLVRATNREEPPPRLMCALHRFWAQRNHFGEGRQWLERGLAFGGEVPRWLRARALVAVADLAFFQRDETVVQTFAAQVVTLDEQGLDQERWAAGFAVFLLSLTASHRGALDESAAMAERAQAIARETGETSLNGYVAIAHNVLALRRGDFDRAAAIIESAVAVFRSLGDKWSLVTALVMQSIAMMFRGDFVPAIAATREGIALSHELSDHRSLSWCLVELAVALAAQQQVERAARLWGGAEGLSQLIGAPYPPPVRALQDLNLPIVRRALGDAQFAEAWTEGRQMTADALVAYAMRE